MSRAQSDYTGPRLPKPMSALVGESAQSKGLKKAPSRTERRKMERLQKKSSRSQPRSKQAVKPSGRNSAKVVSSIPAQPSLRASAQQKATEAASLDVESSDSESEGDHGSEVGSEDSLTHESALAKASIPPKLTRTVRDKLAKDDADIAALERKLGIKRKKTSKKDDGFDDGLDDLFGNLDDSGEEDSHPEPKRKLAEDDEWLRQKRRKVEASEDDFEGFSDSASDDGSLADDDELEHDLEDDSKAGGFDSDGQTLDDDEDDDEDENASMPAKGSLSKGLKRENPYVAPVANGERPPSVGKYIPPSLRGATSSEGEAVTRLNRRVQGLINRLSESNLLSILQSVEELYQENARQHVTSSLINTLLSLIAESSTLSDVFIVLHGAFIAALYRVLGTDFGAQLLERIVGLLDDNSASDNKKPVNLVSLLATMYNFQVISCDIIYDHIRLFIKRFSEDDTELLLRIIRLCGPQLRQDDPSTLKDIASMIQVTAEEKGMDTLSVRQSFMIETINDLKNNRLKTGMAASASRLESTSRMKKLLGTVKAKSSRASEPLRVSLEDIRSSDKKGKWWLIGASYHDPSKMALSSEATKPKNTKTDASTNAHPGNNGVSLLDLARQQGMNTDIRRALFVAVMSAVDYKHAKIQITKLGLKKAQIEELPLVLIRCVLAESVYNAYYSYVAKEFCHQRQVKMAFQFTLWDYCKRMDGQDEDEDDGHEQLNMDQIYRLAKFYAKLVRVEALSITILKKLDFVYVQSRTRLFLEVLLTSVILDKSKSWGDSSVETIFANVADAPDMASGFCYFLQNAVANSEVPQKQRHKQKVAEVCAKAAELLSHKTS